MQKIKVKYLGTSLSISVKDHHFNKVIKEIKDVFNVCKDSFKKSDNSNLYNLNSIGDKDSQVSNLKINATFPLLIYFKKNNHFNVYQNDMLIDKSFPFFVLSNVIYFDLYTKLNDGIFPIHGATIIKNGKAVLLCGKSGVGKSTCYQAAEGKWEQGSDDLAVVKRDNGKYRITPFPTWSNFTEDAKDTRKSWDITKSYPLKAIYLLQHGDDTLEKLKPIDSIMTFYDQISLFYKIFDFEKHIPEEHKEKLKTIFSISEKLSKELPVFRLNHKLGGRFLSLIEDSLEEL